MMQLSLKTFLNRSLTWVMPRKCLVCNKCLIERYPICDDCYPDLPFQEGACQRCGQQFIANLDYCGKCIAKPPPYDSCFCAFKYESPVNQQIRAFKYSLKPEMAMQLARLLQKEVENHHLAMPDLLIHVPVHIKKLRERGFNQSLELAKCLSMLLSIPLASSTIIKHRETPPQAQQTLKLRQKNIRGSFRCVNKINAKHVAIIDDVVTTGATAAEITKILKRNGVDYVQVWGIAHTI